MSHDWPGNVRELRNVAERFALGLPVFKKSSQTPDGNDPRFAEAVEAFEKSLLSAAQRISAARGRRSESSPSGTCASRPAPTLKAMNCATSWVSSPCRLA
ncbi:hypothetical protein D3C85_1252390 [compost metagenome]